MENSPPGPRLCITDSGFKALGECVSLTEPWSHGSTLVMWLQGKLGKREDLQLCARLLTACASEQWGGEKTGGPCVHMANSKTGPRGAVLLWLRQMIVNTCPQILWVVSCKPREAELRPPAAACPDLKVALQTTATLAPGAPGPPAASSAAQPVRMPKNTLDVLCDLVLWKKFRPEKKTEERRVCMTCRSGLMMMKPERKEAAQSSKSQCGHLVPGLPISVRTPYTSLFF
ncbi:hypothetical protein GH733_009276 [Mirounga leonina]|nr:hypothetical protein GH733_009276 [Mirounga leonina]